MLNFTTEAQGTQSLQLEMFLCDLCAAAVRNIPYDREVVSDNSLKGNCDSSTFVRAPLLLSQLRLPLKSFRRPSEQFPWILSTFHETSRSDGSRLPHPDIDCVQ